MTRNATNGANAMKTKTKTQWIVMKDGQEIGRLRTKKIAELAAREIGGHVVRYRKEWV